MPPEIAAAFKIERNPSYASSVRTGLRLGLWMAPTTLERAVVMPILKTCEFALLVVTRFLGWMLLCLSLIGLGLIGRLVPANNQG